MHRGVGCDHVDPEMQTFFVHILLWLLHGYIHRNSPLCESFRVARFPANAHISWKRLPLEILGNLSLPDATLGEICMCHIHSHAQQDVAFDRVHINSSLGFTRKDLRRQSLSPLSPLLSKAFFEILRGARFGQNTRPSLAQWGPTRFLSDRLQLHMSSRVKTVAESQVDHAAEHSICRMRRNQVGSELEMQDVLEGCGQLIWEVIVCQ